MGTISVHRRRISRFVRSAVPAVSAVLPAVPAVLLAVLLGAAGCTGDFGPTAGADAKGGARPGATTPAAARITVRPAAGTTGVDPGAPVRVTVAGGTLDTVGVTADGPAADGVSPVEVTGAPDAAKDTWTSDRTMTPGTSYTVRVTATGPAGTAVSATSTFRTRPAAAVNGVTPAPLGRAVVGVGQPVSLAFDRPVRDKAAVEKALAVTTTPAVPGSWGWLTDPTTGVQRVDWRPDTYWTPGTEVTLTARLSGIDTGGHRYLRRDVRETFTIGPARVSYADLRAHTMRVTEHGRTVRTIRISAGRPAYPTWNGAMVVMNKQSTVRMTSSSVGIARTAASADFYDLAVKDAVQITTSGTFVHAAPWNDAVMGVRNASHGCIGMSSADAAWFFARAAPGDVVTASGSARATVDRGNGYGEWNLSLAQWQALSALAGRGTPARQAATAAKAAG
ncbi:Lipoprotein-anchoring transpeptidase ErfK/SrfK [Streptomyces sp. DvalAA-14]|uniref:L,D-transpeptidase n=1 Tax=unclassified Streptomyces TaxID=2593676 RepID=UPI00081B9D5D|nr:MULTISPECIES: Ig-like domain-containing protein [unclassified Streptomyces]MYS22561.1 L,D-transpeptidase family protein [Streptomyces sp. SID4948]SCE18389.1 Lipoprotein-anchoring transpeptidase ErfK/SrfK [Streptomyces sp. DvalAA-14]